MTHQKIIRVLSGMQPSGRPHIGNYLGAMRQHVALSHDTNYECFYFLANYHALTTVHNPSLAQMTTDLATDYIALGLDTKRTVFFRQSDVPEHTELTWILNTITPTGLLERCHAWKDALAKGKKETTAGLFTYPVLMAADILMYMPDIVPVGQDQKQHVEVARDIAGTFNHLYGETFKLPEPEIKKEVATVIGTDGEHKMSKSYGNVIDIFAPENILKKQIMGMVTDSKSVEDPKDPATCHLFQMYTHFATEDEKQTLAEQYRKGGMGYGTVKKMLLEKILAHFGSARTKREELTKKPDLIEEILKNGAKKARTQAQTMMTNVRKKVGL